MGRFGGKPHETKPKISLKKRFETSEAQDFKPPPGLEQPAELQLFTELPEGWDGGSWGHPLVITICCHNNGCEWLIIEYN